MTVRIAIDVSQPATEEQVEMLKAAALRPTAPDEDCPELSEEELKQFHRVSDAPKSQPDSGLQAFWALREQAQESGMADMPLDEINEEIRQARLEKVNPD